MTKSAEKQASRAESALTSPLENCLEMSNSKEEEEADAQNKGAEDSSCSETSPNKGFQWADTEDFSTFSSTRARASHKKGAPYRRMNRYFKSKKQYWKERNRRKQARQLSREGYTHKQIAEKLGVSERTIQRDMNKTKSYRTGQINKILRAFREERQRELDKQMEGMNSAERLRFMTNKLIESWKLMEARQYHKRTLNITINLDEILSTLNGQPYGRPLMTFSPNTLNCNLSQLRLRFRFKKGEKIIPYSTLKFT